MFQGRSVAQASLGSSRIFTHPDLGTSVQLSPGSVFCDQHALSPMNGRVVWLHGVHDRELGSCVSDAFAEIRSLVFGAEELKPQSTEGWSGSR